MTPRLRFMRRADQSIYAIFLPSLVNDTFGDPGLYVDFRDERRALLFDIGDIAKLMPGKLLRLSHMFGTHTHMDQFPPSIICCA